jgi:hypothetical protein
MPRPAPLPAAVARWIRTECGRAKYLELAARPGPQARLRLAWFVLIAALRDLPLAAAPPAADREH